MCANDCQMQNCDFLRFFWPFRSTFFKQQSHKSEERIVIIPHIYINFVCMRIDENWGEMWVECG